MDLMKLGADPVSAESPAGIDVRNEPEFEVLQAEVDKYSSVSAVGAIDWKMVVDHSSNILATQSKDLLVASYFSVALLNTKPAGEALMIGFTVLNDLASVYWDTLFPPKKRMRGRRNALQWWVDKTIEFLQENEPAPVKKEFADELAGLFKTLDATLREKDEEGPVLSQIGERVRRIPAIAPPKEKPAEGAAGESATTAGGPVASKQDALKVLRGGFAKVRESAQFLRDENLADPTPYRVVRMAAWSELLHAPPATDGKTKIPAPPPPVHQAFKVTQESGDPANVIKFAEKNVGQYIFWLDLHRHVAEAFDTLGEKYEEAKKEVCGQTALFVWRIKGIESLSFATGEPFADDVTKEWLSGISLGSGGGTAGKSDTGKNGSRLNDAMQNAQKALKDDGIAVATGYLTDLINEGNGARSSMEARISLCEFMIKNKKASTVAPYFSRILSDIEKYSLETWEPDLALKGLKTVFDGYKGLSDRSLAAKSVEIWNRMALINMSEALKISGG